MHRTFSSSRLVRLLSDLAGVEIDTPKQDLAERLGGWLGVHDAMALHAAHQAIQAVDKKNPPDALLARPLAVEEEFHRVRTALVKSITASGGAPEADAGYAPYQQRYLNQQRQMTLRIDALRAHVRQTITMVSPPLAQLASLDAMMAQMLGGPEKKLLSTVSVLLERRFEHLRTTRQQDAFSKELEEVLLAELELRFQPVVGLIEAFSNEVKKQP